MKGGSWQNSSEAGFPNVTWDSRWEEHWPMRNDDVPLFDLRAWERRHPCRRVALPTVSPARMPALPGGSSKGGRFLTRALQLLAFFIHDLRTHWQFTRR